MCSAEASSACRTTLHSSRIVRLSLTQIPARRVCSRPRRARSLRQMRYRNLHSSLLLRHNEPCCTINVDRFLDKQDRVLLREARQTVLRALKNEIPSQRRKAHHVVVQDKPRLWKSKISHNSVRKYSPRILVSTSIRETCATSSPARCLRKSLVIATIQDASPLLHKYGSYGYRTIRGSNPGFQRQKCGKEDSTIAFGNRL